MNLHTKRDRLAEEKIDGNSPLKLSYVFDSLSPNSHSGISLPNSVNPRIKNKKS